MLVRELMLIGIAIALIDRMKKLFSSSKSIAAAFNKKDTM